jgi:hypothetical protein
MLDGHYRPWSGGEPKPPLNPTRLRAFIYACAEVAFEDDVKNSGGKVARRTS